MSTPERPPEPDDADWPHLDWAYSFLFDWVFELVQQQRIHQASDLVRLYERFHPQSDFRPGGDFTLEDVLHAATRLKALNAVRLRENPYFQFPYTQALDRTIDLLNEALDPPPSQLPLGL